jgi:SAM-dependent methyltransferase
VVILMTAAGSPESDRDFATRWLCSEKYRTESLTEVNQALLAGAGITAGFRVLEIGAGTGETTELVARRVGPIGSVTALDRSAPMLEALTRRIETAGLRNVFTLVATVEDADLPNGAFDAAIGRYVLMLLPDPTSGLGIVRRALKAGARASMAVFAAPERNPLFSVPDTIFRRHAGLPADGTDAPGLYRLADPARLEEVFVDAGLRDVTVVAIQTVLEIPTVREACDVIASLPLIRTLAERLDSEKRTAAWQDVQAYLRGLIADSVVTIPGESLVAAGIA